MKYALQVGSPLPVGHQSMLGYAYVNFHSVQDAERALDTLN